MEIQMTASAKSTALLLSLCAACASAAPSYVDGNQLLERLRDDSGRHMAVGYVTGVVDTAAKLWELRGLKESECIFFLPAGVRGQQLADLTEKYLIDQPAERHMEASYLVLAALKKAFPCR